MVFVYGFFLRNMDAPIPAKIPITADAPTAAYVMVGDMPLEGETVWVNPTAICEFPATNMVLFPVVVLYPFTLSTL